MALIPLTAEWFVTTPGRNLGVRLTGEAPNGDPIEAFVVVARNVRNGQRIRLDHGELVRLLMGFTPDPEKHRDLIERLNGDRARTGDEVEE